MGRRRGEVQILTDILSVSLGGVKVTHLMYKANLSYSTLHRYLFTMARRGLVSKVNDSNGTVKYRITEKGKVLLKQLKDVRYALSS